MKLPAILLAGSLLANVALAIVLMRSPGTKPAPDDQTSSTVTPGSQSNVEGAESLSQPQVGGTMPGETGGADTASSDAFHWSKLEAPDYVEYIKRLRAFGVPEKVIRDIIVADVAKMYRPRIAALRPKQKEKSDEKFWRNQYGWGGPDQGMTPEQRTQMRALQKEQMDLIKQLLGADVYAQMQKDSGYQDYTAQQFGDMTPEQRDKVTEMQSRYWEAYSDIHQKAQGYMDEDMQAELKAIQKKMLAELGSVLTPEQIKEYQLRTSDVANNMRWQLSPFEPDEKEFRAVFDYKSAMEELTPRRSSDEDAPQPTKEEMKARAEKQKELEKTLADALGADRLKEYKMMDDWSLRNLFESGVPKESVFKISDMKSEAESAARKIRNDKTLTQEQRTEALKAMQEETRKSLNDLLGERRAKAYAGNGGWWIRNLQ